MPIPGGQTTLTGSYATPAQLIAYTGASAAPADAVVQLRAASLLIRHMTSEACYAVDAYDHPTDATLAAAMRDATCAQVAYWVEDGDRLAARAGYASVSIGRVSMTRAQGADGRSPTARLAPDARLILANAQIIP